MMNNTKSQHYVWRHSLSKWSDDGTSEGMIWCLFLDSNEIKYVNLKNLGVENYFYEIFPITFDEKSIIQKLLIDDKKNEKLKASCNMWLNNFYGYTLLKEAIDNYPKLLTKNEAEIEKHNKGYAELQLEYENSKKFIMEEVYKLVETTGIPYLEELWKEKIDFYDCDEAKAEFQVFIAFQYARSKAIRERLIKKVEIPKFNMKNCFLPISLITSTIIAWGLIHGNYKISLIKNKTKIPFIVGELPIVNLKADMLKDIVPTEFELFFPISPVLAVMLSDAVVSNEIIEEKEEKTVQIYNRKIMQATNKQLYSDNQESLKRYQQ